MRLGLNVGRFIPGIGSSGPQVAEGWPAGAVRARLSAFRGADAGTLAVIPMARDRASRIAQLRAVAELAA
ncbi:MAG TPA: hypothetical protein VKV21_02300 [Solirubrobacteraceae bacterium]|nr:hypothetical protein [Solirubrobacteraceae bacterium]